MTMTVSKKRLKLHRVEDTNFTYCQFPLFFFDESFSGLSSDAMVLYTFLKNRFHLSEKNEWTNESDEIYLIMTREEMCKMLRKSKPTIVNAIKDLKKYGLIDEERLGQGRPNLIFLLEPTIPDTQNLRYSAKNESGSKKSDFLTSNIRNNLHQDVKDFAPNNNDIRNIYKNNIENQSVNQTTDRKEYIQIDRQTDRLPNNYYKENIIEEEKLNNKLKTTRQEEQIKKSTTKASILTSEKANDDTQQNNLCVNYNTVKEFVQEQISYKNLSCNYLSYDAEKAKILDNVVDIIADLNLCRDGYIRIDRNSKPKDLVLGIINKITDEEVKVVINRYCEQSQRIKNPKKYITTMLYNCGIEMGLTKANIARSLPSSDKPTSESNTSIANDKPTTESNKPIAENDLIADLKAFIKEPLKTTDLQALLKVAENNAELIKTYYKKLEDWERKIMGTSGIVSYIIGKIEKLKSPEPTVNIKPNKFVNYEQDEWDFEKLELLNRAYLKKNSER